MIQLLIKYGKELFATLKLINTDRTIAFTNYLLAFKNSILVMILIVVLIAMIIASLFILEYIIETLGNKYTSRIKTPFSNHIHDIANYRTITNDYYNIICEMFRSIKSHDTEKAMNSYNKAIKILKESKVEFKELTEQELIQQFDIIDKNLHTNNTLTVNYSNNRLVGESFTYVVETLKLMTFDTDIYDYTITEGLTEEQIKNLGKYKEILKPEKYGKLFKSFTSMDTFSSIERITITTIVSIIYIALIIVLFAIIL